MFFRLLLLGVIGCWTWPGSVVAQQQESRVALVIGNGAYKSSPLKNPVNDSKDVAAKLRSLGFTVVERNNLVVKQIGSTLREFRSTLKPGSVALVYYAGHGVQIKGENYLPAVDAEIGGEEDVPNQSLAMRQIMDVLGDAKTRLNLVFLDACRNNPYARSFRSADDGLSRISAPTGTLISFATRPGSIAQDGNGRNGLYTAALLAAMNEPSRPIEQVLKSVVSAVKAGSKNQQEPWMEGSIEGEFCFSGCNPIAVTQNSAPEISDIQREDGFWADAKGVGNTEAFEAYLTSYPSGRYVALAKASIVRLMPPPPPPVVLPGTSQTTQQPAVQSTVAQGPVASPVLVSPADIERQAWEATRTSNTLAGYNAFLSEYPNGPYSGLARIAKEAITVPTVGLISAQDRRTPGAQTDDRAIEDKSKQRLLQAIRNPTEVNVVSFNRWVLLTGQVIDEAEKRAAGDAITRVENVQRVYNELTVGSGGSMFRQANDGWVSTKVKLSLVELLGAVANHVRLVTDDGVVYLMGLVTRAEADRFAAVAARVSGVRKVTTLWELISER